MTMTTNFHLPSKHAWTEANRNAKVVFEAKVLQRDSADRDGKIRPYLSLGIETGTDTVTVFFSAIEQIAELRDALAKAYHDFDLAELQAGVSDNPITWVSDEQRERVVA